MAISKNKYVFLTLLVLLGSGNSFPQTDLEDEMSVYGSMSSDPLLGTPPGDSSPAAAFHWTS